MKKSVLLQISLVPSLLATSLLVACDEATIENITQVGQATVDVVDSIDNIPKCSAENEGYQIFVKGEQSARICVDNEWILMSESAVDTIVLAGEKDTVYISNSEISCMTMELVDKSGLKLLCNGDSVGVLRDGLDEQVPLNPVTEQSGSLKFMAPEQSFNSDVQVQGENDGLSGGLFLKGSSVYNYELSDGKNLNQLGTLFEHELVLDDGFYKLKASDLVSQYAMFIFEGFYLNVAVGKISDAPVSLKLITDMRKHRRVSVNVLTHLELERVYRLVHEGKTVRQAKKQAQREIRKMFNMDANENIDAEDLELFGSREDDAQLLALTILLQGNRSDAEFKSLLTEIATDIAEDGVWNDSAKMMDIAEWARGADRSGRLKKIQNNIQKGTGSVPPDFIKYIRTFWLVETSK